MAEIGADVAHVMRFAVDILDGLGDDQTDTATPSRSLRTGSHPGPLREGSGGLDDEGPAGEEEEEGAEHRASEGGSRPSSAGATPHHVRSPRTTVNAPTVTGGGGGDGVPGEVRRARGPVVVAAAAQAVAASEGKMSELSGTSAKLEEEAESDTHTHSATHALGDRDVGDAFSSSSSLTQSRAGGLTTSSYVSLAATSESDGAAGRRRVTGDPVSALLLHQATV